jgi:hypothetical protein
MFESLFINLFLNFYCEVMSKEVLHARMIRASNFYHGKYATIEALNCKEPNVFDANNPNAVSVKFHRASDAAYWRKVKENGAIETEIRTGSQGHPSRVNHSFGGLSFLNYPSEYLFELLQLKITH